MTAGQGVGHDEISTEPRRKSMKIEITVHAIQEDGLPDMDHLTGRVAFIFDGCLVSGWPVRPDEDGAMLWEGNGDVANGKLFHGVTHWVEFPVPVWGVTK